MQTCPFTSREQGGSRRHPGSANPLYTRISHVHRSYVLYGKKENVVILRRDKKKTDDNREEQTGDSREDARREDTKERRR